MPLGRICTLSISKYLAQPLIPLHVNGEEFIKTAEGEPDLLTHTVGKLDLDDNIRN